MTSLTSSSEDETAQIAEDFAKDLSAKEIILLSGHLGAGKSVFARALIRALSGNKDEEIPSPTFTIVQLYDSALSQIWHFDLYRLEQEDDIYPLGWEDAITDGIVIVEWPERLGSLIPRPARRITIEKEQNSNKRIIQIENL